MNALPRVLIASFALLCAAVVFACGDDAATTTPSPGNSPGTITPVPMASPVVTASPTPTATPRFTPDTAVLDQPGFRDYAMAFQTAVLANDTQFFVGNAYFRTFDCATPTGAQSTPPAECFGMGAPPLGPGIPIGAWASEGGVLSQADYSTMIQADMSVAAAPGASPFVLGHAVRGPTESDSGIDLAVRNVAFTPQAQSDQSLFIFRVDIVGGEWRIVEAARGNATILQDYYDWWQNWAEVVPRQAHPL